MSKLLLYIHEENVFELLNKVAEENNYEVLRIDDTYLKYKLGDLFLETNNMNKTYSYKEDYMFMKGISKEDLIAYLKRLDELGLEFEGIKVMETETNKTWLLEEVMKETESEHQVMKKVFVLQEVMKSCNEMDLSNASEELRMALMNGYLLLQSGEISLDSVNNAIEKIMTSLKEEKRTNNA